MCFDRRSIFLTSGSVTHSTQVFHLEHTCSSAQPVCALLSMLHILYNTCIIDPDELLLCCFRCCSWISRPQFFSLRRNCWSIWATPQNWSGPTRPTRLPARYTPHIWFFIRLRVKLLQWINSFLTFYSVSMTITFSKLRRNWELDIWC